MPHTQRAWTIFPQEFGGIESFEEGRSHTHVKDSLLARFSTRQEIKKRICDELLKTVPENHSGIPGRERQQTKKNK